jgi:hypothetical protein
LRKEQKSPFYKKYPYKALVSIQHADARGAYDDKLGFFYNRIPKVENSTIVNCLLTLKQIDVENIEGQYKGYFTKPSEMTEEAVNGLDGIFKFVFVRNPYTRLLSAYLDKVVRRKYFAADGKYPNTHFSKMTTPPSFQEFCNYLTEDGLYQNAHWAPQKDLLLLPLEKFDFIGKFESLENDIQYLLNRLGGDPYHIDRAGPPSTGADGLLGQYYSPELYELISELYQEDFNLFGYQKSLR